MFYWLMRYAQQFGKEFPLLAVQDKSEYEVQILVMDCCARGVEYKTGKNLNDKAGISAGTGKEGKTANAGNANAKNSNKSKE